MNIDIIVSQDSDAWEGLSTDFDALCDKAVNMTAYYAINDAKCPFKDIENKSTEVSIVLSDNEKVQELNKNYRGKDKPTNVLSFAALDDVSEVSELYEYEPIMLGDVIVSFETCLQESEDQKKTFENHVTHLLVHGVLHLMGFDHIEDEEADYMESLEVKILAELGIENPYNDRE